jgi:hypothetical protein
MKTTLKLLAVNQTTLPPDLYCGEHLVLVKQIDAECFLNFTKIKINPNAARYVYLEAACPKPLQPSIRFNDLYRIGKLVEQFVDAGTRVNQDYGRVQLECIREVIEFFALTYKLLGCFDNHVRIEWGVE